MADEKTQPVIEWVGLDAIHPYEHNPRNNDGAVEAVAKSITEFGFNSPIIAKGDGEIINGHTRYKAAKALGLTKVPVMFLRDMDDLTAKRYRLADNKTSDLSTFDNKLLLEELDEIAKHGEDLFTGFKLGELFDSTLDEKDNHVLEEIEHGVIYKVILKTPNKERAERFLAEFKKEEGLD